MKKFAFLALLPLSFPALGSGLFVSGNFGTDYLTGTYESPITKKGNSLSVSFGASLGYRYQVNNFVFGLEGEFIKFTGNGLTDSFRESGAEVDSEYERARLDYSYAGLFSLGYMVSKNTEVFGKAGYGSTRIATSAKNTTTPAPFESKNNVKTTHFGIGFRHFIFEDMMASFEYRLMSSGTFEYPNYGDTKIKNHSLRLGAAYAF